MFLKRYIQDLMNERRDDEPLSRIAKACLLLFSCVYGFLERCHSFLYRINLFKTKRASVKVISVGNITLGGTGKTPAAIMLAERLAREGFSPAVLIRGYGEDEWKMIRDKLKNRNIKVFVGRDRVKRAAEAEHAGASCVILDDGFQHRRLARDLDIILIDSTNPFGNGRLFPRGILREPLESLRRADIIVLTKADKGKNNIAMIENELKVVAPAKPVLKARHVPAELWEIRNRSMKSADSIKGKTVCVVSAICDPAYFRHAVEKLGASVGLEFVFPDHYFYKANDLKRIFRECRARMIGTLITTEKDAVKLKDLALHEEGPVILVLGIRFEITDGGEKLDDGISRLHMRVSRKDS
jgi:tetraacyldisaccharide 4'-kinase